MPIQPKYSLGETRPVAARQFTDREEFIQAFQEVLQTNKPIEHRVLMYYGVGGIGKTSLRKELVKLLDTTKSGTISAVLDFEVPSFREQETALFALRKSLKERYKMQFPTFDLAYAVYWHKIRPQIPMSQDNFPWLEEGSILSDVLHIAEHATPFGLIPKAAMIAMKGSKAIKEWWMKRGNKELRDLPCLESTELAERLPMFWAADLKDFLTQKYSQAVLFIDSYEALWEGMRSEAKVFKQDEWVRELVSQLPEILWVIYGRERLRWEESNADWSKYLKQHLVGGLADEDAKRFLQSCGISEESIKNIIVEGSKGVPYYLDLAVDTYYEIKDRHNREPVAADFAKTPQDVLIRFLRYLDKSEIETLKVLSVTRFWNYPLFEHLVTEFKTGYPITAFSELCRFSFINQGEVADTWTMHQLMRDGLQQHLETNILKSVHKFLFNYYNEELKDLDIKHIIDKHKNALNEAFYHGKFCLEATEFFNWFKKVSDIFCKAAHRKIVISLYEEVIRILEKALRQDHPDLALSLNNLANLYQDLGKYVEAEALYNRSLGIRERAFGQEHPDVARSLHNLADLCQNQGKYVEAEPLYKRAIEIEEKVLGQNHPDVAKSLNNLAALYLTQGKYVEAELLSKRAFAIKEKSLGLDHPELVSSLTILANLFLKKGKYVEAEQFFKRTLEIQEKVFGHDHPEVAKSLNNLAVLYYYQGKYTEVETLIKRGLEIKEKILGPDHPDVAKSLNNLATLYLTQGKYAEAEPLYKRSLAISEKALGPDHSDVAIALDNLAHLYRDWRKYEKAELLYQQALEIFQKNFGPNHPDVAESLGGLARLYQAQGDYSKAEPLYQRALQIQEKTYGGDHPNVATLLEDMVKLYQQIGKNEEAQKLKQRTNQIRSKNDEDN